MIPRKDQRVLDLVRSLIQRKWSDSKDGYGLPQGSLASGFLANVYLDEFDDFMVMSVKGDYRRYVDDVRILVHEQHICSNLEDTASDHLGKNLQLCFKADKTNVGLVSDLKDKMLRPELDEFDRAFKRLLRSFYEVDRVHYEMLKERVGFPNIYSACL